MALRSCDTTRSQTVFIVLLTRFSLGETWLLRLAMSVGGWVGGRQTFWFIHVAELEFPMISQLSGQITIHVYSFWGQSDHKIPNSSLFFFDY